MPSNVLVVTPDPTFGEMIRHNLEEAGTYRVQVVNNKASAVVRADEEACQLAFLDMDLDEDQVTEIGQALRTVLPEIKFFVLCDDETPPALDSIRPWTLLRKPFYLPDLLELLEQAPSSAQRTTAPLFLEDQTGDTGFPWLQDATKAAQHLTRLTLESAAQAALITRGSDLWAYAGQLSQSAAQEVAQVVVRNWNGEKGSDLLRFIRLESTRAEHMLFATRLAEGMVLALVFDAETPFSTIHSQASQLITALEEDGAEAPLETIASAPRAEPAEVEDENEWIDVPPISDILTDVPSPDPQPQIEIPQMSVADSSADESQLRRPAPLESFLAETRPSVPLSQATAFSRESSTPVSLRDLFMADQPTNLDKTLLPQADEGIEVTVPSRSRRRPETPVRQPAPGELDETRPHAVKEVTGRVVLEPVTPGLYHLTYACLLIPRFPSHYLTGDLADRLSVWMPSICVGFGWRLEFLAVRPEYLQWIVNVPPATSPAYLMRIMRQQTSEKILTEFQRLKKENPSGDFWAPGYLIMGGSQPHPPQLVKDYIKQIRQRQGISRPSR